MFRNMVGLFRWGTNFLLRLFNYRRLNTRREKVGGFCETQRETAKFTAMKVPRQCPFVLLVKVGWRGGKTIGSDEGRDEQWSKEISSERSHCTQLQPRIQTLNLWRTAYGETAVNDKF
jgi:hypothetical protein